jgi:DNA-binding MarR family transcriptional regulator
MSQTTNDPDYNLWVLLHQVGNAVFKAREKELLQYGITTMEAGVLFTILELGEKATPAEIAKWMFRATHTITVLLTRMEHKGLITRIRVKPPGKKNVWQIHLTEQGKDAYLKSTKRESIKATVGSLTEQEHRQLDLLLRKIREPALQKLVNEIKPPFP